MNADELLEMDPYEEVAQQGHALPLLPAYVPDLMELDEHVPIYVSEPEYHEDSINYPDVPEDDDKDPEEDHTEYPADGGDGDDEPSNDDSNDDDTNDEDEEPTEEEDDDEEEDEHIAPTDTSAVHVPSAGDTKAFKTDDPGHDARTIARAADKVRRQESEDFYTQLHDNRTDRRDIRLEIDVVRGHMTAYEIKLHEVRQAYLSSEDRNRALLARLKTLKTHISRMEWQRQRAKDLAVGQMMRHDDAYAMIWRTLKKKLTDKYCPKGPPRVIVYGYDGLLIEPVAPPSPDYVPGPKHPPSPDYVPGPEHPPSPIEVPYVPEPEYTEYLAPSDDEAPLED
nr:hypothetical protein [Tanacetum cinerariifolium]